MIKKATTNTRTGMEIAVIGMSAKFPGAGNLSEYWDNLENGIESISFLADEELEKAGIDAGMFTAPNYIKCCGDLQGKEFFDASFFGYSPIEAELMDPQIRIFHECVWETLEDAGYNPDAYNDNIGIYAGASNSFYWQAVSHLSGKSREFGLFAASHLIDQEYLCSRVSYNLNLKGASSFVQSACSTSLVAIHQACRSLLTAESRMILAGGVAISAARSQGYLYQEGMILSQDGHCRAFAGNASGTIRGEGAGMVLLKRLKPALEDKDHIYAIIKGTAINNDGNRKVGFTAPSIEAQAEVIRTAQRMARVEPESITYIEAHGTGTSLGDPVEIEALKLAFNTGEKNYCGIGSVKSNFGHLDAAAGAAGFIKTVLALKHKLIPPTLHFESPNPGIDFKNSPFYVNTTLKKWQSNGAPLRAGVSSFGIGGTNAHIILEEAPPAQSAERQAHEAWSQARECQLILLSAKTPTALEKMTRNLAEYFKNTLLNHGNHENPINPGQNPGLTLADAAYTLQVGRKTFPHRKMLVCSSIEQAAAALTSPAPGILQTYHLKPGENERDVIFMFPGQGSQYVDMGLELYQTQSIFREELDRCFEILKPLTNYNIKEILYPLNSYNRSDQSDQSDMSDWSYINQTEVAQPLLFAFEYALAKLLMKWGIEPVAMIGHSIGELAAAHLSGVFSLEQGLKLAALRGRLMQQMPPGSMVSVPIPEQRLIPLLNQELSLAAVNAPSLCVVSGTHQAIASFEKQMQKQGYDCRKLHTSHAFHSTMMEPILAGFQKEAAQVTLQKPKIPYISGLSGNWITAEEATAPVYWARHARETVRFSQGLEKLLSNKNCLFLEVGPGNVLSSLVKRHNRQQPAPVTIHFVRHPREKAADSHSWLNKIGELWLYGKSIDWSEFYRQQERHRVSLPTYPFEGQRFWMEEASLSLNPELLARKAWLKKKQDIRDWFYIPLWKQSPLGFFKSSDNELPAGTKWLVFMDKPGIGTQLKEKLQQKKQRVISVKPGVEFTRINELEYIIHPAQEAHYISLFNRLLSEGEIPGIILHLWNVTGSDNRGNAIEMVKKDLDNGYFSLLYQVRAMGELNVNREIQIMVVTDNMQEVTGEEDLRPGKAAVLGPAKVIPQEYRNIRCRCIDITCPKTGAGQDTALINRLIEEFQASSAGTVVAYRGSQRWTQIYEPAPGEKNQNKTKISHHLRNKGVYLITGGTGRIGMELARYLASAVNARLVLTGRSSFPAREEWPQWLNTHKNDRISQKIKEIQELEKMGAEVMVQQADVADQEQMEQVIRRAEETFAPLNGVIHAAGIIGEKSLQAVNHTDRQLSMEQFYPKVNGVLVLEKILENKSLDFCLLFSSLASVLGGLGFTAYSAANIFMDYFVRRHNQAGPPGWTSINWDGWNFRTKEDTPNAGKKNAVEFSMVPREGIKAFEYLFSWDNVPQIVVSTGDLQTRINQWLAFAAEDEETETRAAEPAPGQGREHLSTTYVTPQNPIQQNIVDTWEKFFGIKPIGIIDNFFQLGGDSLTAVTVVRKLHKRLNVVVPLAEFFNRPTVKELAEYINQAEKSTYTPINPAEEKEYYALSSAQKRLYILQQMDLQNIAYNQYSASLLEGKMDREKLEKAFKTLIQRHEILRSSIFVVKEKPVQEVHETVEFAVEYEEQETDNPAGPHKDLSTTIHDFPRPFDLTHPPFLRVKLIKTGEQQHVLIIDMHHLVTDGVSHEIFLREATALYEEEKLPPLSLRYKDYAEWLHTPRQQAMLVKQESYWLDQYRDEIPVLNLPTDYARPKIQDFEGRTIGFKIDSQQTQRLNQLALNRDVTLFMVLLATYDVFLAKITGQDDVVVGTGTAGRRYAGLQDIIGIFVNTLTIRNHPTPGKTFQVFLQETRQATLEAFENQEYPFEMIVEKVAIKRDTSRNPLFDTMFILQNIEPQAGRKSTLKIKPYSFETRISKFDLTLFAEEIDQELYFSFEYSKSLFKPETIHQFICYFKEIAASAAADPDKTLRQIQEIPGQRKQDMIDRLNRQLQEETRDFMEAVGDITLQKRLGESFRRFHHHTAIEYGSHSISAGEIQRKAGEVTRGIIRKGIPPRAFIGILLENRVEFISVMIGILDAGCVFVPLDPTYPGDRLVSIIRAADIHWIVTRETGGKIPPDEPVELLAPEHLYSLASPDQDDIHRHTADRTPGDNIYIYFTSGTTGTPRAILGKNRSLLHFLHWEIQTFDIQAGTRFSQFTNPVFDAFLRDIFAPLLSSGVICIPPHNETMLQSPSLIRWVERSHIHLIHCVPGLFRLLAARQHLPAAAVPFKTLRYILLSGERLHPSDLQRWYEIFGRRIGLVNLWGTSETTLAKTFYLIQPADINRERIPVGKPLPGAAVVALDRHLELCDPLVTGELYIKTPFHTAGYYREPILNRQRFIPDPFLAGTEAIDITDTTDAAAVARVPLHKTGDLGRILLDGNIDVKGRNDRQVKIRGIRVELEEIENLLARHPAVSETAVIKKEIPVPGQANLELLCAYVTVKPGLESGPGELTHQLTGYIREKLPAYMEPGKFVILDKFPRTPQGKIDYQGLPDPLTPGPTGIQPPRDAVEEKLLEIWHDILKREKEQVSVTHSFFELGGNSLHIMTLIARLHREFDVRVTLGEIFTNPTLRGQANIIRAAAQVRYAGIEPVEKREYYPQSSAQKRLFFLNQLDETGMTYHMNGIAVIPGEIDKQRCQNAFRELVSRHEGMRTSFLMIDEEPVQRIHHHNHVEAALEYYDLFSTRAEDSDREGTRGFAPLLHAPLPGEPAVRDPQPAADIISSFIRPFDLSRAPLVRLGVVGISPQKYLLMFDMHHIISDGTSETILKEDFIQFYNGKTPGRLRLQYKDFSVWQGGEKEKETLKRQEEYWLKEFAGEIPVLDLPGDYPRPMIQSFEGNNINFEIPVEQTRALNTAAIKGSATLFMVLSAAFYILLSKLSHQQDIIIGIPAAGRRHADLEQIIGMFVNTLALRNYPAGEKTFTGFLNELKEKTLEAFENQEYQLEELVEKVEINRDTSRNPLFDVVFVLQNFYMSPTALLENEALGPGQLPDAVDDYQNTSGTAKFDLTLFAVEENSRLGFSLQYCTKLFKKETIERFINYFKKILSIAAKEPGIRISDIEIVSEEEKKQVLFDFNETGTGYPQDKTIAQLFEEQVERTSDHVALVGPSGVEYRTYRTYMTYVSYRELNEKSNQLAHLLIEKGLKPDTIVAIMVERSIEMIIGILGILKSGGAYLPIAPDYPRERIDYMLKDSVAQLLVTTGSLAKAGEQVSRWKGENVLLEEILNSPKSSTYTLAFSPSYLPGPENLAYVIYTSGSTGRPKGVLIIQYNVSRVVKNTNYIDINPRDRILQLSNYEFDGSVFDIFGALLNGALLVMILRQDVLSVDRMSKIIKRQGITTFFITTALFNTLVDLEIECFGSIRKVLFGGERVSVEHSRKALDYLGENRIIHVYGPTEATVYATYYFIDSIDDSGVTIPIGKPLSNTTIYIMDRNLKPVPVGISGEMYIGGKGVARGYLNRPGLTREKFMFNRSHRSHRSYISKKLYKTGDLARWLSDGNIEFLDRIDQQIKIRGFRVELGEIETYILKHPAIKEAVVLYKADDTGDKFLCAYVVAGENLADTAIKEYLSKHLPDYMVPSYVVPIEKIPLTTNGKIDQKALPAPAIKPGTGYVAPRDVIEETLVQIWAGVLAKEKAAIGIDANFFEMGGHSLKATVLVAKIHKALDVQVPLVEIFKIPTIRELAQYIKKAKKHGYSAIQSAEKKEYHALSSAQQRLYVLQQMKLTTTAYNIPVTIPLEEEPDLTRVEQIFKQLIHRHESLRTFFHVVADEPVQRIQEKVEFQIEYKKVEAKLKDKNSDIEGTRGLAPAPRSAADIIQSFIRPFDLTKAPLLRVVFINAGSRENFLLVDMHHIISDGVSLEILEREFEALEQDKELPALNIQYKDFSAWQIKEKQKQYIKEQEQFWIGQFEGKIPVLDLLTDYPRPRVQLFAGNRLFDEVSCDIHAIKTTAVANNATPFMVLLTVFYIFLAKVSGQEDIVIGTPVAGRRHADLQGIMGLFVNSLALRNRPKPGKTFIEFLQEVRERTLDAFDNQDYQFEDLVEKLEVKRDRLNPIFDVMFSYREMQADNDDAIDLARRNTRENSPANTTGNPANQAPDDNRPGTSKFDLYLNMVVIGEKLTFSFEYSTQLFQWETIQSFARGFKEIVLSIVENTKIKLEDVKMSTRLLDTELTNVREELTAIEF